MGPFPFPLRRIFKEDLVPWMVGTRFQTTHMSCRRSQMWKSTTWLSNCWESALLLQGTTVQLDFGTSISSHLLKDLDYVVGLDSDHNLGLS